MSQALGETWIRRHRMLVIAVRAGGHPYGGRPFSLSLEKRNLE